MRQPIFFRHLKKLTYLSVGENDLKELPQEIGKLCYFITLQ